MNLDSRIERLENSLKGQEPTPRLNLIGHSYSVIRLSPMKKRRISGSSRRFPFYLYNA
jgi:hypothetical protein